MKIKQLTILTFCLSSLFLTACATNADTFLKKARQAHENGNKKLAAEYLEKACDIQNAHACNELGFLYYDGKNIKQDNNQALKFFDKACKLGHRNGCSNLKWVQQDEHRSNWSKAMKEIIKNKQNQSSK